MNIMYGVLILTSTRTYRNGLIAWPHFLYVDCLPPLTLSHKLSHLDTFVT